MFYSYELLTQRKYGVATVWLVATLGSKYGGPKLQRKDIMSVDVPKACDTIKHPEAPLALRLQSSLLYGITKCYSQQCGYLFQDVKTVHANVRKLYTTAMNSAALDLATGKTKGPDQNVLQDDPAFLLGADLVVLEDLLDTGPPSEERFRKESFLTLSGSSIDYYSPSSARSRRDGNITPRGSIQGIHDSPSTVFGDFDWRMPDNNEVGQLEEVDYEFGEDGTVRDIEPIRLRELLSSDAEGTSSKIRPERARAPRQGRERLDSDDFIVTQVQRDHAEGLDRPNQYGEGILAAEEPLWGEFDLDGDAIMQEHDQRPPLGLNDPPEQEEPVIEVATPGPSTRKRAARIKTNIDTSIELRSADLASWRDNYIENMENQAKRRQLGKETHESKLYARKVIFEWGIGGELRNPELRALFSGTALLETFTSKPPSANVNGDWVANEMDAEKRQVGSHGYGEAEGQVGLDVGLEMDYDGLEVARDAEPSYNLGDEFRTPMPWNRFSARPSQAGSQIGVPGPSAIFSSGGVSRAASLQPMLSSAGPASITGLGGSRHVSASPLSRRNLEKGGPLDRLRMQLDNEEEEDSEIYLGSVQQGDEMTGIDEIEFFGPGALVPTQDANSSQWLNKIMEKESSNFLEFVKSSILDKVAEEDNTVDYVTMNQIIPPRENRAIVGAHALQHILLLATRDYITVQQNEAFGDITIRLTARAHMA